MGYEIVCPRAREAILKNTDKGQQNCVHISWNIFRIQNTSMKANTAMSIRQYNIQGTEWPS